MRYIILFIASLAILSGCSLSNNTRPTNEPNQNFNQGDTNINESAVTGNQNTNIQVPGTTPEPEVGTPVNEYTLGDVAKHSLVSDCWLVANAKVYNVTSFIPTHPGGEKILQGCGKDMTEFFNTKHLKQSKEKLPEFYIGDLK